MSRTKTSRKPDEIRTDVKRINMLTQAKVVHLHRPDFDRALKLALDKTPGFVAGDRGLYVEGIEVRVAP